MKNSPPTRDSGFSVKLISAVQTGQNLIILSPTVPDKKWQGLAQF